MTTAGGYAEYALVKQPTIALLTYQHVYDSYCGEGHSIYPPAA